MPARNLGEFRGRLVGSEVDMRDADHDAVVGGAGRKRQLSRIRMIQSGRRSGFTGFLQRLSIRTQVHTSSFEQIFSLDKMVKPDLR